jgi:hypothetical protein
MTQAVVLRSPSGLRRTDNGRRVIVVSLRGKYAHLGISVKDFMEEKRRDAEREY